LDLRQQEKEVRYDGFATQLFIWMLPSEDDFSHNPRSPRRVWQF
jgi:hypothetical protein